MIDPYTVCCVDCRNNTSFLVPTCRLVVRIERPENDGHVSLDTGFKASIDRDGTCCRGVHIPGEHFGTSECTVDRAGCCTGPIHALCLGPHVRKTEAFRMEFDVALADDVCQGVDHDRVGLKQSRKCIDGVDRYCAAGKAIGSGSHLVAVAIERCIGSSRYQYITLGENP